MKSLTRTCLALIISGLCLTKAPAAVMMGFEENTADHFIWNSGLIPADTTIVDMGVFWRIDASYHPSIPTLLGVRVIPNPTPSPETTLITPFGEPISTEGDIEVSIDPLGFHTLTATYHDAIIGKEIGNIRVEGWLKDPNAVPEGGSTLPLLALGLLGFLSKTRRREH